jgi:hypothetical protein
MEGSVRGAVFPRAPSSDRALRAPWSGVLAAGWIAVGLALVAVASTSRQVGKPVWWLGDAFPISPTVWWIVPLLGPFVAVAASVNRARTALIASGAASVWVLAVAVRDLGVSPAAGVVEMLLGGVGVLLTVAASAGVPTRHRARSRR